MPVPSLPAAMAPARRIARNSAFNALGMMLIVPLNFIGLFVLARRLGASGLGIYFTLFAIAAVIHWIADAGIMTVLTRRIARSPEQLKRHVAEATGLLLVVCGTSISLFCLTVSGWLLLQGTALPLSIFAVSAVAIVARHTLDFAANALRGLERFEFENLARVLQAGLFCLFVLFFVDVQRFPQAEGTLIALVAFAVSNVVAAGLIAGVLLMGWRCGGFRLSRSIVGQWLRESAPLGLGDTLRRLMMQLDTLLLAGFASPAAVGLFSVAVRPLQPLQLLPRTIVSVTFPMMSRLGATQQQRIDHAFGRTSQLLWAGSLPIAIAVALCARPLILATAGPNFVGAVIPLQILIAMTGLFFLNTQLRFVLTALDAQRQYSQLITTVLVVKITVECLLIPWWGLYGACVGNMLGEVLLWAGGLFVLRQLGFQEPRQSRFARSLIPAAVMGAVLYPIAQQIPVWNEQLALAGGTSTDGLAGMMITLALLLVATVFATAVYGVTCWFSGAVDREMLHRLYSRPHGQATTSPLADLPPPTASKMPPPEQVPAPSTSTPPPRTEQAFAT